MAGIHARLANGTIAFHPAVGYHQHRAAWRAAHCDVTMDVLPMPPAGEGGTSMRPRAITHFERIMLISIMLRVSYSCLIWNRPRTNGMARPYSMFSSIAEFAAFFIVFAVLTLLISRRRNRLSIWLLVTMIALSLQGVLASARSGNIVALVPI